MTEKPENLEKAAENAEVKSTDRIDSTAEAEFGSGKEEGKGGGGGYGAEALKRSEERLQAVSDAYVRLQADFDNFRRRTRENEARAADLFTSGTAEKFLPVLDNFELALRHMKDDEAGQAYVQGFELLQKQLVKVMQDLGVTEMDAAGKPFDTRFHEAVMQTVSEDVKDDTVGMVLQKGYMYKDTVMRPAKVQVLHCE